MKRLTAAVAIPALVSTVISTVITTVITTNVAHAGPSVGDLVRVRGVRSNQLVGLGLVVGLRGTGDTSPATREAVRRLSAACGFDAACGSGATEGGKEGTNAALVVVTAEFPPFAAEGARIDVTVSATADAGDISGGTLVATPLRAGKASEVYVRAQGPVSAGDPARPATVGIVRGGGIVERAAPPVVLEEFSSRLDEGRITLDLKEASAEAAMAVSKALEHPGGELRDAFRARAVTPGEVEVTLAAGMRGEAVGLLAHILAFPVDLAPRPRIVVNERLGTVAASGRIMIAPAAVSAGGLLVTVGGERSAALAATERETEVPGAALGADDASHSLVSLTEGVTLEELVRELRGIRATSQDVIEVLRGLVKVGALRAEIVVE
ncbi:MAG: flagellar basal body P-ring protein FlgI [Planctomycetota bacterium]|jgi:flagellar P-ring protein precursor FlgI